MCVVCELRNCSRGDHLHKSHVEGWGSFCGSAINIIDSVGHIVLPLLPSFWAAPTNLCVTVVTKSKSIAYFRAREWNYIIFHLTFAFCLLFPFSHSQFFAFCFSIFLLITTPRAAVGNQGVSNGNRSGSCAWAASNWLGVQISALIWFLIIILCSVSSRTLAEPKREKERRAGREFHASRASKYAARYFLLLLRAKFVVYVCMARCVYVCAVVYYYFTCAIFCHVSFRFVWFGFVLVFVVMLLFFRLPSLRHSSIIHIDFFCFSPLPTPLSSALLIFLVSRCPKMFLLIFCIFFVYFVICSLSVSPATHM